MCICHDRNREGEINQHPLRGLNHPLKKEYRHLQVGVISQVCTLHITVSTQETSLRANFTVWLFLPCESSAEI